MGFKNGGSSSRLGFMKIVTLVFRFLQIVFALAVVGLYAQDLNKARKVGKYSDSKWVTYLSLSLFRLPHFLFPFVNRTDRASQPRSASSARSPLSSTPFCYSF